jgi:hypothetical protein
MGTYDHEKNKEISRVPDVVEIFIFLHHGDTF